MKVGAALVPAAPDPPTNRPGSMFHILEALEYTNGILLMVGTVERAYKRLCGFMMVRRCSSVTASKFQEIEN